MLAAVQNDDLTEEMIPSDVTCRRVLRGNGHAPRKRFMSGLLLGVTEHIRAMQQENAKDDEDYGILLTLRERFEIECFGRDPNKRGYSPSSDAKEASPNRTRDAIDLVRLVMSVDFDDFRSVERQLFKSGDDKKIYFECYRFSSEKGIINKSFTVFHRPNQVLPLVRFANYMEHNGRVREARGIVVPFKSQFVLVGHVDKGRGVKLVVFPECGGPQDEYHGLVSTIELNGTPVAARTLFVRSTHSDHVSAGAKVYEVGPMLEHHPEIVEAIRNKILFQIEEPVFDERGRELGQEDIVRMIDRYLESGEDYKITDQQGKPFNPAADRHYTFNAALKITG